MKKLITLLLGIVMIMALSHKKVLGEIEISPWVGFTTVAMGDVNDLFKEMSESLPAGDKIEEIGSGLTLGVDLMFEVDEGIKIGPRIGYILPSKSKNDIEGIKFNIATSLIPIQFGGKYSTELQEGLNFTGGAFVGIGLGKFVSEMKIPGETIEFPYSGSGLVFDLSAGIDYALAENIAIGANLGYRLAKIAEMTADKDVEVDDLKKGDKIKDDNDKAVEIDFSGVSIAATIQFKF